MKAIDNPNRILALSVKDKLVLGAAYLPFLKNGGIFVPTEHAFELEDEVFILLSLLNAPEKILARGEVSWIIPRDCQEGRLQGIGVHFDESENSKMLRKKIEAHLGGNDTYAPGLNEGTASRVMEVSEIDPLDGVAIYIEYGHYEHAAQTLRWHVERMAGRDLNALRKLLEVYFRLGQIDDYAKVIERLHLAGEHPDFVKLALFTGLRQAHDHAQLRVLAKSHLAPGSLE
ncbi:MAG: PilZ domain-containing protein [Burkholderiales bacterium]|nr:PilZ domain-containing protein [Burkholderiales bacterium]